MRALVVGAGGFVGRHLVPRLTAEGVQVRALVTDPSQADAPAEVFPGDLLDAARLDGAAARVDVVFHVGACIDASIPRARREALNVQGTRNLLDAARRHKVRRLVYLSSPLVLFTGHDVLDADETWPYPAAALDDYAATRIQAERLVREAEFDTVAIRSGWTWGPDERTLLGLILRLALLGPIPLFGDGANLATTTYIENLVDGLVRAAQADALFSRIYHVTDEVSISQQEMLRRILEAAGLRARFRHLPAAPGGQLLRVLERLAHLMRLPQIPLEWMLALNWTSMRLTSERARADLGYRPGTSMDSGMKALAAWLDETGRVEKVRRETTAIVVPPATPFKEEVDWEPVPTAAPAERRADAVEYADILILGAGPAGASAALTLQTVAPNCHVVVLDERTSGRPTALLPEALNARARAELLSLGLDPIFRPWRLGRVRHVRIELPNGRTVDHRDARLEQLWIDRDAFHWDLMTTLGQRGVDIRPGWSIVDVLQEGERILGVLCKRPDGALAAIQAPLVLDASGRYSVLARRLQLRTPHPQLRQVGVSVNVEWLPDIEPGTAELHLFKDGESSLDGVRYGHDPECHFLLVTDFSHKRASGAAPLEFFHEFIKWRHPRFADRLRRGGEVRLARAMAPLGYQSSSISGAGWLLVGDAAGFLSPHTGRGIDLSLRMGRVAAGCALCALDSGDFTPANLADYVRLLADESAATRDALRRTMRARRHPIAVGLALRHPLLRRLVGQPLGTGS